MKKCKSCNTELPFVVNNGMRSYKHKFGYGIDCKCLAKWSFETEEGRNWREKQTAYKMKRNQKEKQREERKLTRQMKIELMSTSEYWSDVFQPKFNELIRIIDKGSGCIATGRTTGKMNAGHYYHAGSNKTLSINAHNIFLQSFESNHYQSGDVLKYEDGVTRIFGTEYLDFIKSLKKCPSLHLSKIELIEARVIVMGLIKKYKHDGIEFLTPYERIELRNEVNQELNLYPKNFMNYEIK